MMPPGVTAKQLSLSLHLNPSTITRFLDALEKKHLIVRQTKGKSALIHPSSKGLAIQSQVACAYKNLVTKYSSILGPEETALLSFQLGAANEKVKEALGGNANKR